MKLDDTARQLIDSNPATLVTVNRDGSPQISLVWMVVQSTTDAADLVDCDVSPVSGG